jgi:hypothetical protein
LTAATVLEVRCQPLLQPGFLPTSLVFWRAKAATIMQSACMAWMLCYAYRAKPVLHYFALCPPLLTLPLPCCLRITTHRSAAVRATQCFRCLNSIPRWPSTPVTLHRVRWRWCRHTPHMPPPQQREGWCTRLWLTSQVRYPMRCIIVRYQHLR